MKFYDCKPAPSPRRVRMFMAEKGIDIPTVQVDLRNGEHLSHDFRMINPHCTVPVLLLDDGTRLVSTAAIWRYLEETHPEPPLMGRTAKEKALVADTQWRIESEGMGPVSEALRNSAPGMKDRAVTGPVPFEQIPALAERGKKRAALFLQLRSGDRPGRDFAPIICSFAFRDSRLIAASRRRAVPRSAVVSRYASCTGKRERVYRDASPALCCRTRRGTSVVTPV